ncbi:hypothetical protein ACFST9_21545 [Hymenobacter monticola]|uniref:Uncharacterized protein n=1 Tax=Hymenobacter monticola TaxID=1705399 RepID=A0ABY4BCC1_9BACT|nr:hypothetical protein [Hymenobacter monticola]UOE34315.1 hypothetical protein MTP16_01365 [Hymenobacter monticola]
MVQHHSLPEAGRRAAPEKAAEGLREAISHARPRQLQKPVQLRRQATPPEGLRYALVSFWEERCAGAVKRTTIDKTITLHWKAQPAALEQAVLTYETAPPVLQKPSLTALEKALLLLASLYQRLEIDATPAGQLLSLRNHAEVLKTWAEVQAELIRRSGGEDEVTQVLLQSVGAQLERPDALLASLRHDYAFAFLWPDLYQQRFESGFYYEQAREFPLFFTDTSLWFRERLEVAEPTAAGQARLRASGNLDAQRTDLDTVARQVDAAFTAAGLTAPPTAPFALSGTYEASFDLNPDTGWPVTVEASVICRAGAAYSKEYFLRFEQLPAS